MWLEGAEFGSAGGTCLPASLDMTAVPEYLTFVSSLQQCVSQQVLPPAPLCTPFAWRAAPDRPAQFWPL